MRNVCSKPRKIPPRSQTSSIKMPNSYNRILWTFGIKYEKQPQLNSHLFREERNKNFPNYFYVYSRVLYTQRNVLRNRNKQAISLLLTSFVIEWQIFRHKQTHSYKTHTQQRSHKHQITQSFLYGRLCAESTFFLALINYTTFSWNFIGSFL